MTDPKNPFAAMMAAGQDWARAINPALQNFTPQGFEAMWPTMPRDLMETMMGVFGGVPAMSRPWSWPAT